MSRDSLFRTGYTNSQKLDVLDKIIQRLSKHSSYKNYAKIMPDIIHMKIKSGETNKLFLPKGLIKTVLYSVDIKDTINDKDRAKPVILNVGLHINKDNASYALQLPLDKVESEFDKNTEKNTFCKISFDDERVESIDLTIMFYIDIINARKVEEESK